MPNAETPSFAESAEAALINRLAEKASRAQPANISRISVKIFYSLED